MRISDALPIIERRIRLRLPAFLWGPPGIGKSAIIKQICKKQNLDLIDIRAVLLDPVDLRGLPVPAADGTARWFPPAFLPHGKDSKGVLFLDELAQAPALTQSACLQLVLDRKLGEYHLPEGWTVVAASNRQEDKAGAHKVISSLLNRFSCHLEVNANVEDWMEWARDSEIHPDIRSFIATKPNALCTAPDGKNSAFATPRTWEMASLCLKDGADVFDLTTCVGVLASELDTHRKFHKDMIGIEEILAGPSKCRLPTHMSVKCMVAEMLIDYMRNKPESIGKLWTYSERLPKENTMTIWIWLVKKEDLRKEAMKHTNFKNWSFEHGEMLKRFKEALK